MWPFTNKKIRKTRATEGTKANFKYSTGQLFNFTKDSYLERTSRPIYSVAFLLLFIVVYEVGTFCMNTNILNHFQTRVVAFVWMQNWLGALGLGGKFAWAAPGLAVVIILFAQQITSGKQWKIWLGDFLPMLAECVLLAIPLIVLTLFLNSIGSSDEPNLPQSELTRAIVSRLSSSPVEPERSVWANIVTGIGAGIYEELVFRLILICILMLLFQDAFKLTHNNAIVLSVLLSAALFSAHHHVDLLSGRINAGEPFDWVRFAFRTIAGVYFAFLYAIRGFGITAGTHSFYNIIAVSLKAWFF